MSEHKIQERHRQRLAVIYVRQSSLLQVEHHAEGRDRQYQLVERAQRLGWPAARCLVIDEDMGISAAHTHNRPGYQRLITMLALREVGLVLGLDVSRLARNSLDWYQLLELAGAFDVLIADEDGIYHPGDFNDRLLLGLKGTMSEVELYQIHARLVRGQLNKAKRGELVTRLPIGLEYDRLSQAIRLSGDQSVRHAIEVLVQRFRQVHSVRGVLRSLVQDGLELPHDMMVAGQHTVVWRPASYEVVYAILTNPTYAGVYCYGRRQREAEPLTHTVHQRRRSRDDWLVFLPDHHPGYLTLAEFDANQAALENNRMQYPTSQGAPGRGSALLQGLVFCQHCGHKMRLRYSRGRPYYTCDVAHRRWVEPICNRASAARVDALVEDLLLSVVNSETLAASRSYDQQLRAEARVVDQARQEQLQRLEYQVELARRRYEFVDPANRLVAQTLETEWNARLLEVESAKRAYAAQRVSDQDLTSTVAELKDVVSHLRDYWYGATISAQEKKEIVRCLIVEVRLENQGKLLRAHVHWQGGTVTALDVPKYLFSTPALYHRIARLAEEHPDSEIATLLTAEGLTTAKGRVWTARHVMDFRHSNAIPSRFTNAARLRVADSPYLTSAEVAEQLGIEQTTVQKWYKLGLLEGKQAGGQSQLWIAWSAEVEDRLSGRAKPDPRLVSVRSLCRTQRRSPEAILRWAQREGHVIYRLRRGTAMRFFILPKAGASEQGGVPASMPGAASARERDTGARQGTLGAEATRLLALLTAAPQAIPVLGKALGLSKRELEHVVQAEYEALLRAGLRPHVATASEVPRAIRLPSRLNPQEYTYFSKLARSMGDDHNGEMR
ncbi:MAG: recombinase family protein [Chloroflexota bacterium]